MDNEQALQLVVRDVHKYYKAVMCVCCRLRQVRLDFGYEHLREASEALAVYVGLTAVGCMSIEVS